MQAKRQRTHAQPSWEQVHLFGPGGEDGSALLGELAGDSVEAIFACTMGLNATAILEMIGVRDDIFAVIACQHPERCWHGDPTERRCPRSAADVPPVERYPNVRLLFPPFCDAPERLQSYENRHAGQAPRGLIGCVHPKLLVFFRQESVSVVVATANLTKGGWTGTRNHLWHQDFPARANADWRGLLPDGSFCSELACMMASLMARCAPTAEEAELISRLSRYDFSGAAHTHLVCSVPGLHPLHPPPPPAGTVATVRCALAGAAHAARARRNPAPPQQPLAAATCCAAGDSALQLQRLQRLRDTADAAGQVRLELRPLVANRYDPNAIGVHAPGDSSWDGRLGFLPREVAAWVAPLLRCGVLSFEARVHWQARQPTPTDPPIPPHNS